MSKLPTKNETGEEQTGPASSLESFRLVKFFSFTGLAVFLVSTMILSWVISNHAKKVLLERSEAYALVFAENLNHQVFQQFVLPTVLRFGKIALRNPKQFERLDYIVKNTIHGMKIQSLTIFDSTENVISYSTIADMVGQKDIGKDEYRRALKGVSTSTLVSTGSLLYLLPGAEGITCQLKTYIPFRHEKEYGRSTDAIMGVIEIVQDLSDDLEAIVRLQGMIITTSILIMSTVFTVLWFIVARADRIITVRARERRRLEEKLFHSEKLASLGKMVASVSHEIKNPLGIIRSTAELLKKRLMAVAPGNDHLATIIIDETSRLNAIVTEFLDFARPQNLNFIKVDVNEILLKAARFMAPEFENNGIKLITRLEENLAPIEADPNMLYRVFLNLMVNGVQAMPEGGSLSIVTSRSASPGITIEITDSGIGMSEEIQAQVFNPFFTQKNRGTGLGLAIVKNILDSHHATIAVKSEEGKGSTFRIFLRQGK